MNGPADLLAVWLGVDWREQGRAWGDNMTDPAGLFAMPFLRWCGLYLPAESRKETVFKLGDGTAWADVREKLLERKKQREAARVAGA